MMDSSKMDRKVLISKIENLQEEIKNQSLVSQLDIDLQLDYIRKLYDAYLELKCNFTNTQEKSGGNKQDPTLPDCGTLSLFDDSEEKEQEIEKIEEVEKTVEIKEIKEIVKEEIVEALIEKEVSIVEIKDKKEEDETPIVEMEAKVKFSIPAISVETPIAPDINLDDIEFDESSGEEEVPVMKNNPTAFPASMPHSHSRYYGDEIEIENPIPVQPITVGEQFKNERPSLNEIVSSYKPDDSIGSKLQQGNASDLMKSMDMNHKFMFVKELFKGNGSAFTEEINKLNAFNKLNEAIPYWESIKTKYKWDNQSEAYTELYRLVLRKFAK